MDITNVNTKQSLPASIWIYFYFLMNILNAVLAATGLLTNKNIEQNLLI